MLYVNFNTIYTIIHINALLLTLTDQIILKYKINKILEKTNLGSYKEKYKEIVHPQVLLRIPCYDLSPVSSPTMDPHIT